MKTPLSPSQLLERGQIFAFGGMCQELMDPPIPTTISLSMQQTPSTGQSGTYSLCDVCNLQLTSAAQAQLHYNGRSHLRRVRQLQAGETGQQTAAGAQSRSLPQATGLSSQPAGLTPTPGLCPGLSVPTSSTSGSGCGAVGGALPGLIGATGPSVMMKPFLSFPVETSSPVGLFPNFNTMDPVQKAVINHTFGVTLVPKKKQVISCNVCQLRFNSDSQAEAHYRGSRHQDYVTFGSKQCHQQAKTGGSKHKTMLEARSGAGPIKAYPRPGAKLKNGSTSIVKGSGLQNKTFHCQICDVHVNSEIQLKQHISSRRHKDRVAGKPSKPKYSPYNKQQRGTLTTELVKPSLSPSFLTAPFAPPPSSLANTISIPPTSLSSSPLLTPSSLSSSPLLTTTSSPHLTTAITLHHRPPASSSLFTASFLRPAPGPIRASQGSILFAPY
ncbi:LOW QUALITY PROTEIN: zinc finger protein 385B [Labrus bergylta]|uniref:LOW QUALITY PROTEIN: zinc finger protein 385B n=1 Tax=Labrus bergylta TaxID=56723 RepID=UPI00331310B3